MASPLRRAPTRQRWAAEAPPPAPARPSRAPPARPASAPSQRAESSRHRQQLGDVAPSQAETGMWKGGLRGSRPRPRQGGGRLRAVAEAAAAAAARSARPLHCLRAPTGAYPHLSPVGVLVKRGDSEYLIWCKGVRAGSGTSELDQLAGGQTCCSCASDTGNAQRSASHNPNSPAPPPALKRRTLSSTPHAPCARLARADSQLSNPK